MHSTPFVTNYMGTTQGYIKDHSGAETKKEDPEIGLRLVDLVDALGSLVRALGVLLLATDIGAGALVVGARSLLGDVAVVTEVLGVDVQVAVAATDSRLEDLVDDGVTSGADLGRELARCSVDDGRKQEALEPVVGGDLQGVGDERTAVSAAADGLGVEEEQVGNAAQKISQKVLERAAEPALGELLLQEERRDAGIIGDVVAGTVGKRAGGKSTDGVTEGEVGTALEVRVGVTALVELLCGVVLHGLEVEVAVAVLLGVRDEGVPLGLVKRVVVTPAGVTTGDGDVELEKTVTVKPESWAEGVAHTAVLAGDTLLADDNVTTSKKTDSAQNDRKVIRDTVGDTNGIGGLGEGGDTRAVDVAVVGECLQLQRKRTISLGRQILLI